MRAQGIIIGAGVIGSAVAYELSRRGISDLHVFDPDLEGSLSSTERNAGGVRHLWQNPVNVELARHSIAYFERVSNEIGFQQTGYLWLYAEGREAEGHEVLANTRRLGLTYEELAFGDIERRYPFIDKREGLAFGIFGGKDGLLNSNALKNHFRDQARQRGVSFHERSTVAALGTGRGRPAVSVASLGSQDEAHAYLKNPAALAQGERQEWEADFVILCAGAWAKTLLQGQVPDPMVQPVRRQISLFKAENFDMTPYGMIVDTSRVYFHPEGGNILAGFILKDEKPGYRFDYDDGFFQDHIWPALYERSTKLERLKHLSGWAGLYSYTPDTSGILGRLPGHPGFFEAHSFTGRGVMQSYGAAVAVAELVLEGKFRTIDAGGLGRERFSGGKLLREGLHI